MSEIYAISDDILSPDERIVRDAFEILQAGVKFYQYRCKKASKNEAIAREILNLCHKFDAKFIINDDVKFAAHIGAKAVHLGRDDGDIAQAREILGADAFIGVSCYADINLALKAQEKGASYVAFGAMFASQTKPNAPICPFHIAKKAKRILRIPVCVIGGITAQNISQISSLNPDMIAVISAIYKPDAISKNIANLNYALNHR